MWEPEPQPAASGFGDLEEARSAYEKLISSPEEKALFDECFERFFAWRRPDEAGQAQDALAAVMPPRADVEAKKVAK